MPKPTFFRLPREKHDRLLASAWAEFTSERFSDVSINRIIQRARIPRGSFYQYFSDKEDLFNHLVDTLRGACRDIVSAALDEAKGDLFSMALFTYDRAIREDGSVAAPLENGIRLLQLNRNMDAAQLLTGRMDVDGALGELFAHSDLSALRRTDEAFLRGAVQLLLSSVACAMSETLRDSTQRGAVRAQLAVKTEIIRRGCEKEAAPV